MFGVEVLGLDLSDNMVDIAIERARAEKLPSVWILLLFILKIRALPLQLLYDKRAPLYNHETKCL